MEEYRHRKAPELLEKGCLILDWSGKEKYEK
jgi:hypothetical protein